MKQARNTQRLADEMMLAVVGMTSLPGFAQALVLQQDSVAEVAGLALTQQLLQPRPAIDKATGYLESHSPLFAGSDADPQQRLF